MTADAFFFFCAEMRLFFYKAFALFGIDESMRNETKFAYNSEVCDRIGDDEGLCMDLPLWHLMTFCDSLSYVTEFPSVFHSSLLSYSKLLCQLAFTSLVAQHIQVSFFLQLFTSFLSICLDNFLLLKSAIVSLFFASFQRAWLLRILSLASS